MLVIFADAWVSQQHGQQERNAYEARYKNMSFDFTDEELSVLSDDERDALAAIDDEAAEGDEDSEIEESQDDTEEAEEVAEQAQPEAKAEAKQPEPEQAQEVEHKEQPVDQVQALVQAYQGISAEIDGLTAKFEAGDISFTEFNKQNNELLRQQMRVENAYAEIERNKQAQANEWQKAQDKFFADEHNAILKEKPLLYSALGAAISDISTSGEADGKPYSWILEQAKARVEDEIGVKFGSKAEVKSETKPKQKRALDSVKLPQTLGSLPAAESNDSGNEFAYLDRMTPMQREAAMEKMTPAQLDRYLAA